MGALAVILAAIISATIIHELGHALACLFVRLPIERFAVWPLSLERQGNSWKLAIWPKSWVSGAGGFVQFVPNASTQLKLRWLAVLLAGPLASASAACIGLSIHDKFPADSPLSIFFKVLALTALLETANIIPFKGRKGLVSDGRQIWNLIRTWHEQTVQQALLEFVNQIKQRRPRDWDQSLLNRVTQVQSLPAYYKSWLHYKWNADSGRFAEARAALDQALAHRDNDENTLLLWESVWFEAFATGDQTAARQRLAEAERTEAATYLQTLKWRALTAVAVLEGRASEAESTAATARERLKQIAGLAPPGYAALLESDLTEMLSRLPQP